MRNEISLSGMKIIKQQNVFRIEQHINHIDTTDLRQAEHDAMRNALAALDKKLGQEAWMVESCELQGNKFVTVFSPVGSTATRLFTKKTTETIEIEGITI